MGYRDFLRRKSVTVFQDLDAILNEPVSFKVVGEIHTLTPPTTEGFYRFIRAMNQLYTLEAESKTPDEIVDIYCSIITPLVPTLTRRAISRMTIQQANSVFNFVVETVIGKSSIDNMPEAQKKNLNLNLVRH
jgi:hypothetical protein